MPTWIVGTILGVGVVQLIHKYRHDPVMLLKLLAMNVLLATLVILAVTGQLTDP